MSVQAITWALGKAPNIASQAVLFSLANHANEWGITYVGQETVAGECVCRRPTVTANMAKLEDEGIIARVRRHGIDGRRSSDIVILAPLWADRGDMHDADKNAETMFSGEACRLARQGTDREPSPDRQRPLDERLGTDDVRQGQRGVHEPSVEPSVEPLGKSREGARAGDGDADLVWEHYLAARKAANPRSNGCKLNPDDARLIREALKVRPVEDILAAIDGLFRSQWHRDGGFIGIKYAVRGGGQRPNAGATIDRLANGRGGTRLKDRTYNGLAWDELTAHAQASAKEAAAMRLEVWDGGKDSWEGAEERRAAAAAVTFERRRNGQVTAGAWDLAGDD